MSWDKFTYLPADRVYVRYRVYPGVGIDQVTILPPMTPAEEEALERERYARAVLTAFGRIPPPGMA